MIAYPKLATASAFEFPDIGMMFLCMLFGPSFMGILLSGLVYGKSGLKDLFSKMMKIKIGLKWYFFAIFTVPILLLITLLGLSITLSNAFLPGFQVIGIILGFAAGYFEEIGWTGFALPELLKKHTPIKAGIILGLLWGVWHFLADYLGASASLGATWLPTFFFRYLMALVAYRILMVWAYSRVKSVFLAQLMHGCFSGALYLLGPVSSNENAVIWNGVFAAVLWIFTIYVVVIRNRKMDNQITC